MKKKYIVYMKNGNNIEVSKEKFKSLSDLLTKENCPQFVKIDTHIISISAISYCTAVEDKAW